MFSIKDLLKIILIPILLIIGAAISVGLMLFIFGCGAIFSYASTQLASEWAVWVVFIGTWYILSSMIIAMNVGVDK